VQIHRAATKKKLYSGSSRKEIFIMENNNWNENNVNNNNNMNTSSTENNTNGTAYTAESGGASASQPESGSTYGYSYLNQEQKNPNNIWRADENTTGAYTGSSYNSAQSGTSNGYGTYSNPQSDQTNGGAYTAQSDTANGNAYGSTQQDYANNYSNIYGKANHQSAGWNTYSDAKQQKKAERAQRRAAKKSRSRHKCQLQLWRKTCKMRFLCPDLRACSGHCI